MVHNSYYENSEEGLVLSPMEMIRTSKIGSLDFLLLSILGFLLTLFSVYNFRFYGLIVILGLVVVIGVMRPSNIILVWLTFMYFPELLTGIQHFRITVLISMLLFLFHGKTKNLHRISNKITLAFSAFLMYLAFLLLLAPDKSLAMGQYWLYIKSFIVMVIFMGMMSNSAELGRVLKWWAIVSALSLIPAIIHYKLGPSTWLYHAYEVTGAKDVQKGVVSVGSDIYGRMIWAGVDPNGRGATLMFPLGIALAFFTIFKGRQRMLWASILGCILICILGTYSRSSFLSICFVFLAYALVINLKAIVPLFFAGIAGLIGVSVIPAIRERILGIHESIVVSGGSGRLYFWKRAFERFTESPIVGNGLRDFVVYARKEVHNTYLELLTDGGMIAFAIFCGILLFACLSSYNGAKLSVFRSDSAFGKTVSCGMFGLCAMIGTVMMAQDMVLWMAIAACFLLKQFQDEYWSSYYVQC